MNSMGLIDHLLISFYLFIFFKLIFFDQESHNDIRISWAGASWLTQAAAQNKNEKATLENKWK